MASTTKVIAFKRKLYMRTRKPTSKYPKPYGERGCCCWALTTELGVLLGHTTAVAELLKEGSQIKN